MKRIIYVSVVVALALASCVPSKEFSQLSSDKNNIQQERDELMKENEYLTVENREMRGKIDKVEDQQARLVKDSIRIYGQVAELQQEMGELERKYTDLNATHQALLRGNARETRRLVNELQGTQDDLVRKEQLLKQLETDVNRQKADVLQLQAELEARNARLMEMEEMLSEKDRVLEDLKHKVANALAGFEGEGLSVYRKDGRVYVSMDEKLLFQTGSTQVDPKGVQALQQLATVLGSNPDIRIMIEGHTDDVPFRKGASIKDNWDLSVLRATSIVRILTARDQIDPERITVAGRGEYYPVDSADTPEARRKNRRTEIILSPDFTEVFRILDM